MTEASYTAWDDKHYVWPPPDGWYEASDGKWWPQGYGPPKTVEQDEQPTAAADRPADNGWQIDSPDDRAAGDARSVDVAADAAAGFGATTTDAVGLGFASGGGLDLDPGFAADPATAASDTASDAITSGADGATSMIQDLEAPDLADPEQAVQDDAGPDRGVQETSETSETSTEEEAHQASVRVANEAFGTGLMPPMADRPAPAEETLPSAAEVSPPLDVQTPVGTSPIDLDGAGFDNAGQTTITPGLGGSADQQAMLASRGKGSSRGLLFAILGAIALVAAGAVLFYAVGGDGEAESTAEAVEATGPGSVDEPHPRATGVVVYYPDGGVEQRWIVEVLEPVRDATAELGQADEGLAFAATRIRVTNESGDDEASLDDLRFNLVDGSNAVVVRTDNACPAAADDLDFSASVVLDSSIEGTVCWAIQAGDLADLKLGIESSKVKGRIHILLQ